jgi:hypothetical protein
VYFQLQVCNLKECRAVFLFFGSNFVIFFYETIGIILGYIYIFSKCRFDYFFYFLGNIFQFLIYKKLGEKKKKKTLFATSICAESPAFNASDWAGYS